METTDVVIVGAGIAGASVAWHLSRERRVTLIEQGGQPLAEASAQNAGILRRLVKDEFERDLTCRSHELLIDPPSDDWADAPPFRRTGGVLALAEPDPDAIAAVVALRARGVLVEELEGAGIAAVAPAMAGCPAQRAYFVPDDGVCDAWTLGQGFLRGAARHGARLRPETRVESIQIDGDRVTGVRTDRGVVNAPTVVVATAAWSRMLADHSGLHCEATPLARHLFQSAPHPLADRQHPWCWVDPVGLYIRPEAGGFLCSPCDETERYPAAGPGSRGPIDPTWRAIAQDKLDRWLPALRGLRLTTGWNGLRTFGAGREPLIGPDRIVDGLHWATALGGAGVGMAFALGEMVARSIVVAMRSS